ncbi:MAG: MAPEG family protein [Arenimonas sp.]|nr:MAPEG family protein [Arenimonas sp.]MBP7916879.1 MAPEG family protein [Arenimonas sp.]
MTITQWCVLAACLLPILTVGLAKGSLSRISRREGGYDNANPREWEAKLVGWHGRANSAQNNGYEALPLFIAGVLFAQMGGADQARIDMLALAFIAARLAYTWAYLSNHATLRSLIWATGFGVSIALLVMG